MNWAIAPVWLGDLFSLKINAIPDETNLESIGPKVKVKILI